MREIKFRAWDKEDKKMEYCGNERIFGYSVHLGHLIMQFTGLLDKNGKEIYEGDIVKNRRGEILEVYFRSGCFGYRQRMGDHGLLSYIDGTDRVSEEVIGNVWENKELLK